MAKIRFTIIGLTFLILGIMISVNGVGKSVDNARAPMDYEEVELSDYKEGMIIEGDVRLNYGCYETYTETDDNGGTRDIGGWYLIDIGDNGYTGLYVTDSSHMAALSNQFELLKSGEYNSIEPFHFKGKVVKMDSEDQGFIRQYLSALFADEDTDELTPSLYIKMMDDSGTVTGVIIMGIVMILLGLVFLFLAVRRFLMGR